jgi:hypothetical protein
MLLFAKEAFMARWEYRVCAVGADSPAQVEEQLNSRLKVLSDEGWRFVETIYAHSLPLLLFRKPAKLNVKFGNDKQAAT